MLFIKDVSSFVRYYPEFDGMYGRSCCGIRIAWEGRGKEKRPFGRGIPSQVRA